MIDYFEAENHFYLYSDPSRIGKFLAHAKLYEMTVGVPGHFMEIGIFKGASFCRFRKLGRLLHPDHYRMFLGFDVFGKFPEADYEADRQLLEDMNKISGEDSIDDAELMKILADQGLDQNVELIKGDVRETLPVYAKDHQEMTFACVNIDVDLYEPIRVAMEQIFPMVAPGGIIMLDDYEGFPGAKKAVDDYLRDNHRPERIEKLPFAFSPCHILKQ
ncbi:MAG: dTDP-6-deoxy-L-hexose 3-O-methyltransferase [Rhodospirillaceae bacterium]|jgi:hypothetical protein|nr:dTDP-6-deoxy-L-hexose 3-O-methyltransferase [Rhodospirillaceae bacterium]MBT5455355.1 dTDP-6-deoxy-L-hexose 3-O-methyltransferase [Rhodospirillaceae bacterium]